MDQNSLDKIFKKSLENHKTSLDKDALWVAINGNTPKRRFGYLRLLSILGAGALLGFTFLYSYGEAQPLEVKSPASFISQSNTTTQEINNHKPEINKLNQENPKSIQTLNTVPISITKEKKLNSIGKSKLEVNQDSKTTNDQASFFADKENHDNREKAGVTQVSNDNSNNILSIDSSASSLSFDSVFATRSSINNINSDIDKSLVAKASSESSIEKSILIELSFNKTKQSISPIRSSEIAITGLGFHRKAPLLSGKQRKQVECYDYSKKRNKFSGEIYTSVDFVSTQFEASNDLRDYMQRRDETQTQLEGYRSGLRLKYSLSNGLYIKAGLEAGLIKERFNEEISEEIVEIRPNQLLEITMSGDSTIFIYGDAEVTVQRNQIWRVTNTYKSLGIPLLIGYQRQIGRFRYGIDIGAVHNLIYDFDGFIANASGSPLDNPGYFRPNINLSLTGGLSLSYALRKRLNLFLQTSFKQNLEQINTEVNQLQQKNRRIGLGIGVEYLIN